MSEWQSLHARLVARVGSLVLDVELDTAPGTLVLIGPNGAGKTSLLTVLLGAHEATRGRIAVGPRVLFDDAACIDVPLEQRRIGYVPQDYALFPHLSVRHNLEFALRSARSEQRRRARARCIDTWMADLGIETLGDRRTHTLSGGEKQRVALARALCVEPVALLLDEPLAALDVDSRRDVRAFLAGYLRKIELPTIVVTHDAADAHALGDRIAVLEAGKLTQTGSWQELKQMPASRFIEAFVTSALV